jgi:hypothetical protein
MIGLKPLKTDLKQALAKPMLRPRLGSALQEHANFALMHNFARRALGRIADGHAASKMLPLKLSAQPFVPDVTTPVPITVTDLDLQTRYSLSTLEERFVLHQIEKVATTVLLSRSYQPTSAELVDISFSRFFQNNPAVNPFAVEMYVSSEVALSLVGSRQFTPARKLASGYVGTWHTQIAGFDRKFPIFTDAIRERSQRFILDGQVIVYLRNKVGSLVCDHAITKTPLQNHPINTVVGGFGWEFTYDTAVSIGKTENVLIGYIA